MTKTEAIRAKLIAAEENIKKYGHSLLTPEERLEKFKKKAAKRHLL